MHTLIESYLNFIVLVFLSIILLTGCVHHVQPSAFHKPMTIIRSTHHGVYSCVYYVGNETCVRVN